MVTKSRKKQFGAIPVLPTDTGGMTSLVIKKESESGGEEALVILPAKNMSYILKKRGRTVQPVWDMSLDTWVDGAYGQCVETGVEWIPSVCFTHQNILYMAHMLGSDVMKAVYPFIRSGNVIFPLDGRGYSDGDYVNTEAPFAASSQKEPFAAFMALTEDERSAYMEMLDVILCHRFAMPRDGDNDHLYPIDGTFVRRVNGAVIMGAGVSPRNVLRHAFAAKDKKGSGVTAGTLFLYEKAAGMMCDFISHRTGITRFIYNTCDIQSFREFIERVLSDNTIASVSQYAEDRLKSVEESIAKNGYDGRADANAAAAIMDDVINIARNLSKTYR